MNHCAYLVKKRTTIPTTGNFTLLFTTVASLDTSTNSYFPNKYISHLLNFLNRPLTQYLIKVIKIISPLSLFCFLCFYDSTNKGELDYCSCCVLKCISIKSQRCVIKTIANLNRAVDFQFFFVFYEFLQN